MPGEMRGTTTYETQMVGAAYLVKELLARLGVAAAIDQALDHQPTVATTYGTLAQVVIVTPPWPTRWRGPLLTRAGG